MYLKTADCENRKLAAAVSSTEECLKESHSANTKTRLRLQDSSRLRMTELQNLLTRVRHSSNHFILKRLHSPICEGVASRWRILKPTLSLRNQSINLGWCRVGRSPVVRIDSDIATTMWATVQMHYVGRVRD
jgi:hypothetical protein